MPAINGKKGKAFGRMSRKERDDMIKERNRKELEDVMKDKKPSIPVESAEAVLFKKIDNIIELLEELVPKNGRPVVQSTDLPAEGVDSAIKSTEQTIEFSDATKGEEKVYNQISDSSFYSNYNADTELGAFLKRPVLIHTTTWDENTDLLNTISPWTLYFNDVRIKKKLDNYAFISATLKVKLMINASPFYYGIGIMSYLPLPAFNGNEQPPGSTSQLFAIASQRPHVYFYPQSNQGGELTLPYINYKDWLDLTNIQDMNDFGTLQLATIGNLRNANSVNGTGVSIQVYAWAEDVRLAGNTVELALQSEDAEDEYEDHNGIVSKPASAIAKALGMLDEVPVIGPYATTASWVVGAIGTVASWFGFTNTPNIESVQPFFGKPFHGYCSPEISRPSNKLTLDPKNELTVDPRVCGMDGKDDMLISNIIEREAFLFQSAWDSTTPVETRICTLRVNPNYFDRVVRANDSQIQYTPLGIVNGLFGHWHGSIIYRFQFLVSKYHRGRVRLTWDPLAVDNQDATSSTVAYNKIIDISETPNFEVCIPYQQTTSYRATNLDTTATYYATNDAILTQATSFDNGLLTMRVFTALTSPVANAPGLVNVSVRAGPDFEFANPQSPPQDIFVYPVQSQDEEIQNTEPHHFFEVVDDKNRNLVYMGEVVKSIRMLLRRTCLSRILTFTTSSTISDVKAGTLHNRTPYYPGFDPAGIHLAVSPVDGSDKRYNFVHNTPFTWIRDCYLGWRGSIEWTQNLDNNISSGQFGCRRVNNGTNMTLAQTQFQTPIDYTTSTTGSRLKTAFDLYDPNAAGEDFTNNNTFTGLHTVAPMYSEYRMHSNDPSTATFGSDLLETRDDALQTYFNWKEKNNGTNSLIYTRIYQHTAIGPDFSLLYFINVPAMFNYAIPDASAVQPYP